ncbi:hypothetical protein [Paenibacillus sp. Y412MC10]|uniref:hypothetical protein n=1 Tax=Geobacillus sp. (strain Y412MC10) TaxID=481743 RepID=UPI0011AB50F8|nr:hypothetical protein [Paenibacillus sp. Y412MC10]
MELLIIIIVLLVPAVVGFFSGLTGSVATVVRSETMNSRVVNENHQYTDNNFFESEHETHGWKPEPLSQAAQESITTPEVQIEHNTPMVPEVSSLPLEVENGLKTLMHELGFVANDTAAPDAISEGGVSVECTYHVVAGSVLQENDYDIDRMIDTIMDSDIPPPDPDNLVPFPGQNSPLPSREYNAIRRVYGSDFADQITTTPSLGATDSDIDVMMGRVSVSTDGVIHLTYKDTSIPIRGVGITTDLVGEVVLVKGFFIDNDTFMVDETEINNVSKRGIQ